MWQLGERAYDSAARKQCIDRPQRDLKLASNAVDGQRDRNFMGWRDDPVDRRVTVLTRAVVALLARRERPCLSFAKSCGRVSSVIAFRSSLLRCRVAVKRNDIQAAGFGMSDSDVEMVRG
jgi:hypothetical protein